MSSWAGDGVAVEDSFHYVDTTALILADERCFAMDGEVDASGSGDGGRHVVGVDDYGIPNATEDTNMRSKTIDTAHR